MKRRAPSGPILNSTLAALLACLASCASDASTMDTPITTIEAGAGSPAAGSTSTHAGSGAAGAVGLGTAGRGAAADSGTAGTVLATAGTAASAGDGASGASGAAGTGAAGAPVATGASGASGAGTTAGAAAGASGASNAGSAAGSAGAPARANITVWIAGDSTVANGETPCPVGWGADFQSHFDDKVKVVNSAVGGRSVRTWLYNVSTTMDSSGECVLAKDSSGAPTVQARWQQMLDGMKTGDYLFIQFGINDSSATCDRHVGLAAFKQSYGTMAKAAQERGAHAIFVTPVSSISCNGTTARGTRGGYVTATQEAGQEYDVPVIDLHQRSVDLYNSLGLCPIPGGADVGASTTGKAGSFFCDDHTHFERSGAAQIGELIVQALREQQIELAGFLK